MPIIIIKKKKKCYAFFFDFVDIRIFERLYVKAGSMHL